MVGAAGGQHDVHPGGNIKSKATRNTKTVKNTNSKTTGNTKTVKNTNRNTKTVVNKKTMVNRKIIKKVDTVNPLEGGMAQRLLSQRDELIQVKKTTSWLYHPASWFLSIKWRLNIYKTSLIDVQAGLSNITEGKTYHHDASPPSCHQYMQLS